MHSFAASFQTSQGYDDLVSAGMQLYLGKSFASYTKNEDLELDKLGVDAIVRRTNGKTVYVDYKIDSYNSDSIALEMWSNKERGKVGWACDTSKLTDYVVFVKPQKQYFLIFPFLQMQHFIRNEVKERPTEFFHRLRDVRNPGYTTSIALFTLEELKKGLGELCQIAFPADEYEVK